MDQDVGYCPQSEALDPLCSVEEVLYTFCRLKGVPSANMEEVELIAEIIKTHG